SHARSFSPVCRSSMAWYRQFSDFAPATYANYALPSAVPRQARDSGNPPCHRDEVDEAVRAVADGDARLRVPPGDLAARAPASERPSGRRPPEAAHVGVPVVAGDDDAEAAVDGVVEDEV